MGRKEVAGKEESATEERGVSSESLRAFTELLSQYTYKGRFHAPTQGLGASSPVVIPHAGMEGACRKRAKALGLGPRQRKSKRTGDASLDDVKKKKPPSPKFSAKERLSEAYRRVDPETNAWKPPRSPYRLLQESHAFDPWRVLIICFLLNCTTGKQVKECLEGLFRLCPDAETTAMKVPVEKIEKATRGLGFQKMRAARIKKFSLQYLGTEWTHVTQLHGVGKYAADAYAIFCTGKPELVDPQDHQLVKYWGWICGKEDIQYSSDEAF